MTNNLINVLKDQTVPQSVKNYFTNCSKIVQECEAKGGSTTLHPRNQLVYHFVNHDKVQSFRYHRSVMINSNFGKKFESTICFYPNDDKVFDSNFEYLVEAIYDNYNCLEKRLYQVKFLSFFNREQIWEVKLESERII